jgi:hypothetical protein
LIEKPSTASFRIILSWEARFARMVLTPTGNSMAISTIEKFKTFGMEARLASARSLGHFLA